jgi:hypothetical protein
VSNFNFTDYSLRSEEYSYIFKQALVSSTSYVSSSDVADINVVKSASAAALNMRKLLSGSAVIVYSLQFVNPVISEAGIKANLKLVFENGTVVANILTLAQSFYVDQLSGISYESVAISDSTSSTSASSSAILTTPAIGGLSAGGVVVAAIIVFAIFRVSMRKVNPDTEEDEDDEEDEDEEEEVAVPNNNNSNNNYDDLVNQKMQTPGKLSSIVPI